MTPDVFVAMLLPEVGEVTDVELLGVLDSESDLLEAVADHPDRDRIFVWRVPLGVYLGHETVEALPSEGYWVASRDPDWYPLASLLDERG